MSAARPIGKCTMHISRFKTRVRQSSPNREASRHRRRRWGGSGIVPVQLRHHYSEGMRSVLGVVADQVKRHGACTLCLDKIAAIAGVCRTTAQAALHEARRLGHIAITERPRNGAKSLTNVVRILAAQWIAALKKWSIGSNSFFLSKTNDLASPTYTQDTKQEGVRTTATGPAPNADGLLAAAIAQLAERRSR